MARTSQALDRNALHQAARLYLPICSGRAQGCPLGLEDDRYRSAGLPSTAAGPDSPIVMTRKSWTESECQSLPAQPGQPETQVIRPAASLTLQQQLQPPPQGSRVSLPDLWDGPKEPQSRPPPSGRLRFLLQDPAGVCPRQPTEPEAEASGYSAKLASLLCKLKT